MTVQGLAAVLVKNHQTLAVGDEVVMRGDDAVGEELVTSGAAAALALDGGKASQIG